ncbi:MAG: pyridoxal-phosphate dependent enzyme [Pseudonocardiales bacterium]|nr:pyridoxal-phosphate dependent enzyme [Pseudonocardiales bacterium]MBW0011048.1 pyridoxal-phosphate dependent enzyme [Pseudonocardiales bacterium]
MSPSRTPVVALDLDVAGARRRIWLKLESHNPHGSLKDRTAETLWESVRDRVHPAEGVIESTSGNLGIALAARCADRGVPFTAVVDPRTSPASIAMMRRYGAQVAMVHRLDSRGGYLLSRLEYVREQIRARPNLVWSNQYENDANPRAHRERTAPELWGQIRRPATVMLAVSTGGTLAGFHQFAQRQGVPWTVVGVDVEGSLALSDEISGKRVLTGIGSSQRSAFVRSGAAPLVIVSAHEAVAACLWVLDVADIALGGSSGALVAAALRWFRLNRHDDTDIAVVCPDGGDRYLGTVYSAVWRKENIAVHPHTPRIGVLRVHREHREANSAR